MVSGHRNLTASQSNVTDELTRYYSNAIAYYQQRFHPLLIMRIAVIVVTRLPISNTSSSVKSNAITRYYSNE